jgi:hypothetical protein
MYTVFMYIHTVYIYICIYICIYIYIMLCYAMLCSVMLCYVMHVYSVIYIYIDQTNLKLDWLKNKTL